MLLWTTSPKPPIPSSKNTVVSLPSRNSWSNYTPIRCSGASCTSPRSRYAIGISNHTTYSSTPKPTCWWCVILGRPRGWCQASPISHISVRGATEHHNWYLEQHNTQTRSTCGRLAASLLKCWFLSQCSWQEAISTNWWKLSRHWALQPNRRSWQWIPTMTWSSSVSLR